MSTVYLTEFSDLSNIPKKDAKVIESQFPFVPPDDVKFEPCGQIVQKGDIGSNVKFCPICDFPMIVRIINYPCEHVMCYECSQPEKEYCYICEEIIEKRVRLRDSAKLYECDYPDCFKFFDSHEKLKIHKSNVHGIMYEGGGYGMNMGTIPMNFNGVIGRGMIPGQFVNPMMGMGINPYMVPNGSLNNQNANTQNNTSTINPINLNNVINAPQN